MNLFIMVIGYYPTQIYRITLRLPRATICGPDIICFGRIAVRQSTGVCMLTPIVAHPDDRLKRNLLGRSCIFASSGPVQMVL